MRLKALILLILCAAGVNADELTVVRDPHSFARPDEAVVRHLDLDLMVDFEKREIQGEATLDFENRKAVNEIRLDTKDLQIERVTIGNKGKPANFRFGETSEILGTPLIVEIPSGTKRLHITYRTSPNAEAVQWLAAEQTAGKKHPFLFTQSQSILARTWIPLQDTPGVRFTYHARVHVPVPLVALMSAEHVGGEATEKGKASAKRPDRMKIQNDFEFRMSRPIPSYLLALAVGDLEFRKISSRCGVYAEPSTVDRAAFEFQETEKMLVAAEKLYGSYRWGRYDIIVLPPSFPFGGMENPRLTFATPTILAGDRSLVSLVAHELAHSWSGNLVTNATWDDFWLNEGFTVFIEHRIMEELYGKDYSDMLDVLSFADLERHLNSAGKENPNTILKSNLEGEDPDRAISFVAYDKGRIFLKTMEALIGQDRWDRFVRDYFDHFSFRSITTEAFLAFLRERVVKGNEDLEEKLMLNAWIYEPGLPPNAVIPHSTLFKRVDEESTAWSEGKAAAALDTAGWSTQEWQRFLGKLPSPLSAAQMAELDEAFSFSASGNSEILFLWLTRVVESHYEAGYPALEKFLLGIGRLKFVMPLYARLTRTEDGKVLAKDIYRKARTSYHPLTANAVNSLLQE